MFTAKDAANQTKSRLGTNLRDPKLAFIDSFIRETAMLGHYQCVIREKSIPHSKEITNDLLCELLEALGYEASFDDNYLCIDW